MIAKGQDASNIQLGDTFADDKFAGQIFDYCMSNPPYGVDWKASEKAVKAERAATGEHGRFGRGLPRINDGQMLFLTHLVSKMRPARDGGGRAGIVLNGSPLSTGAAGSGESDIRRALLENDLVDAIIGLPTDMFYNTGIATYIWILDNGKPAERRGKVQLIDGTTHFSKMRKSLGINAEKSEKKTVPSWSAYTRRSKINRMKTRSPPRYFRSTSSGSGRSRSNTAPRRRQANQRPQRKSQARHQTSRHRKRALHIRRQRRWPAGARRHDQGLHRGRGASHVTHAWVDAKRRKLVTGFPITRLFYKYIPPRPLEEIDAELNILIREILDLLREVES